LIYSYSHVKGIIYTLIFNYPVGMQYSTACKRKDKNRNRNYIYTLGDWSYRSLSQNKKQTNKTGHLPFFLVILMIQRILFKITCGCWWARMQSHCALLMLSKPCEGEQRLPVLERVKKMTLQCPRRSGLQECRTVSPLGPYLTQLVINWRAY